MKGKLNVEKLVAKYLLGDITAPKENNLRIGQKVHQNEKSFSIVYAQILLFVNVTKLIHISILILPGNGSKRNIAPQSFQLT